jgi:non-ribosomal peptide synthetase component F
MGLSGGYLPDFKAIEAGIGFEQYEIGAEHVADNINYYREERIELPDVSGTACLHELFERQVDQRGTATALICGDRSLTYAELETRANQLAHFLRSVGVKPGSFVGLCMERSELPIIAILACLKAGGAYVPLDPANSDTNVQRIADETDIDVTLTERRIHKRLSRLLECRMIDVDECPNEIDLPPSRRLTRFETGVQPSDACHILFTSGTSGWPKGVVSEHRNVTHAITAFNNTCITTHEDRIFQGFSLDFHGSIEEIWMAFSTGATLVLGGEDTPRLGNDLARYLREAGITSVSTVPTVLSTMTEDVPSVRQLIVRGEICPPELVQRWAIGRRMLNVYASTEVAGATTVAGCISASRRSAL